VFALVLCTLDLQSGAVSAQIAASAPPAVANEPFSGAELPAGKKMMEAECAAFPAAAVWVVVDGARDCIRYYHSTAGGGGSEAVIFFSADVINTNARGEMSPSLDFHGKRIG